MRYTTIIDISEIPEIYRNTNARLIYFHLSLKSGYHDDDRDQVNISIRRLALETGITISATRHALKILKKHGLIIYQNDVLFVKKFVLDKSISPRIRSEKKKREVEIEERNKAIHDEQVKRDNESRAYHRRLKQQGTNALEQHVKELILMADNGDTEAQKSLKQYRSIEEKIRAQIETK